MAVLIYQNKMLFHSTACSVYRKELESLQSNYILCQMFSLLFCVQMFEEVQIFVEGST